MILILLLLINFAVGEVVDIISPSILTFNYSNDKPYSLSIGLNNRYFRESSVLPYNQGLFSIGINPGKYYIDTNEKDENSINYNYYIETGKILKSNNKLNDILLKKDWTLLEKIVYQQSKDHYIKISSMINLEKYNKMKKGYYEIKILINDKIHKIEKLSTKVFKYLSNNIEMKKGFNMIIMMGKSIDNFWCSCMTIGNGFNYGRHLTSWIILKQEEMTINISITESKESMSNIITIYQSELDDKIFQNDFLYINNDKVYTL
jgi:hypothetical protein